MSLHAPPTIAITPMTHEQITREAYLAQKRANEADDVYFETEDSPIGVLHHNRMDEDGHPRWRSDWYWCRLDALAAWDRLFRFRSQR